MQMGQKQAYSCETTKQSLFLLLFIIVTSHMNNCKLTFVRVHSLTEPFDSVKLLRT